jgi:hypothetical protein
MRFFFIGCRVNFLLFLKHSFIKNQFFFKQLSFLQKKKLFSLCYNLAITILYKKTFFLLFGRCLTEKNSTKRFSKEGPARKLMAQAFLNCFYSFFLICS